MRKTNLLLIALACTFALFSCNEDENPCQDETLNAFRLIAQDEDGENIYSEDAEWDADLVTITYIDEEGEVVSVDFEAKEYTSGDIYFESQKMSELSLDGTIEYLISFNEELSYVVSYVVERNTDGDCISYAYEATDEDGENLGITSGLNPGAYVLVLPTPGEGEED
ncbi:hypothetical protein ACFOUP_00865 [Belliella kenyensis]|uniref:Uncharacterized protein n=1 Tax=Belliella kenyensis TaxID=1472724 RepID=A0ABV8EH13_9BACT|nr:hypothetical protein [Belliella kenyensis]MCH7401753.1 hypothetical protein [Belliella kenyensis]MDN3604252.1 hypothetical protein [Belliella kenyensis]